MNVSQNQNSDDLFNSPSYYIMIVSLFFSASTSLMLIFVLKDKIYAKSKLMLKVTIAETVSICSCIWLLFRYNFKVSYARIFRISLVYRFFGPEQKDDVISLIAMDKVSLSLFYSFQTYSILMSSFICLEMLFSLKYPIAKIQKRVNIYVMITYFMTGFQFIILMIFTEIDKNNLEKDTFISKRLFNKLYGNYFRYVNVAVFIFFIVSGAISIIYLALRFCKGSVHLAKKQKIAFVIKHCFFVFIYLLFYLPLMINDLIFASTGNTVFEEVSFIN